MVVSMMPWFRELTMESCWWQNVLCRL